MWTLPAGGPVTLGSHDATSSSGTRPLKGMACLKSCVVGVIVIFVSQLQWVECAENPIKHLLVLMVFNIFAYIRLQ